MKQETGPTIVARPYQQAAKEEGGIGENSYRGLRIHALPGLHAHVAHLIGEHLPANSSILDLAAGSGAMSLRLVDAGFSVTASDYVPENFRPRDIPFRQADFNGDFTGLFDEQFDAVVAVEIIEHLENPRHFLRCIARLLRPGGLLFLSTPNIDNPDSLALWLRSGYPQWFSEDDYRSEGHITPLPLFLLRWATREAGLMEQHLYGFGIPGRRISRNWWKLRLLSWLLDHLLVAELPRGEVLIGIFEKNQGVI